MREYRAYEASPDPKETRFKLQKKRFILLTLNI